MTSCGNPHILLKNKESDKVEKEYTENIFLFPKCMYGITMKTYRYRRKECRILGTEQCGCNEINL